MNPRSTWEQTELVIGDHVHPALVAGPEDGPVVVLLHGFPTSPEEWRPLMSVLGAAGFRCLAPAQRGYAPTCRPDGVGSYTYEHLIADVVAFGATATDEPFHLVGHDWGAAVAWQVAGRRPDVVRSLSALSVPHPAAFRRAVDGEDGSPQAQRSLYIDIFRDAGAADGLLANEATGLRGIWAAAGPLDDDHVEAYLAVHGDRATLDAALSWYRANLLWDASQMGSIRAPTLHVWSTLDPAIAPEGPRFTGEHVEGPYRFEVLEGGHWLPEEHARELAPMLVDLFGSA